MANKDQKAEDDPKSTTSDVTDLYYPLEADSYRITVQISGEEFNNAVFRAICTTLHTDVVVKQIDIQSSITDSDTILCKSNTAEILCHPNILTPHCSFKWQTNILVIMPYISGGSFNSIVASSFPDGLTEPCIAAIIKQIISALSYLHRLGYIHGDVKPGNILIDSDGTVKLADFGCSASVYEGIPSFVLSGKPYWFAPEISSSFSRYDSKIDIWGLGITALELAHGMPPIFPHIHSSMIIRIDKRFRSANHYKKPHGSKKKLFSESFKNFLGLCLNQEPSRRPSAEMLINHRFFNDCKGPDFLIKNVLRGLPYVDKRFKKENENVIQRRIMGWNFNFESLEVDPFFEPPVVGKRAISKNSSDTETNPNTSPGQVPDYAVMRDNFLKQMQRQKEVCDNESRRLLRLIESTVSGGTTEIKTRDDPLVV